MLSAGSAKMDLPPVTRKVSKPKREKIGLACNNCRLKKVKCSGSQPCLKCVKSNVECVYAAERKYIMKAFGGSVKSEDSQTQLLSNSNLKQPRNQDSVFLGARIISSLSSKEPYPSINKLFSQSMSQLPNVANASTIVGTQKQPQSHNYGRSAGNSDIIGARKSIRNSSITNTTTFGNQVSNNKEGDNNASIANITIINKPSTDGNDISSANKSNPSTDININYVATSNAGNTTRNNPNTNNINTNRNNPDTNHINTNRNNHNTANVNTNRNNPNTDNVTVSTSTADALITYTDISTTAQSNKPTKINTDNTSTKITSNTANPITNTETSTFSNNTNSIRANISAPVAEFEPEIDAYASAHQSSTAFHLLDLANFPPKHVAFNYVQATWNIACISFRFYHRPTVYKLLESVYELEERGIAIDNVSIFNHEQRIALPLFYMIFACGILFINEKKEQNHSISSKIDEQNSEFENVGLDYFNSAKALLDLVNGSDNRTIQTLFMMSLYCQFTAKLPQSYTYNSLAVTAMMKKGYYKKQVGNTAQYKNPLQGEVIKRMFWSCYKTEIYMSTILGYPIKLKLKDITQDFPIDTDDENISNTHITLNTDNELISSCGINNVHTNLMLVMYEIKEHYQDLQNNLIRQNKSDSMPIVPSRDFLTTIEVSLSHWIDSLPEYLKPSSKSNFIPPSFLRINKLLHLDYLGIKLMLYKPFTQADFENGENELQSMCLQTCVEVIHLAEMMWHRKILTGTYWFSQYTLFFAVALLTSWKFKCGDSFDDVLELNRSHGVDLLHKLKDSSVTSKFIYSELSRLFDIDNNPGNVVKTFFTTPCDATSENLNINSFEINDGKVPFDELPFFEAELTSDELALPSIFDQLNDLFRD